MAQVQASQVDPFHSGYNSAAAQSNQASLSIERVSERQVFTRSKNHWYRVNADGTAEGYVTEKHQSGCHKGQDVIQNNVLQGSWKKMGKEQVLYLHNGYQGLGIYDADHNLVTAVNHASKSSTAFRDSNLVDSSGKKVYDAHSFMLTRPDGTKSLVLIQNGAPPRTAADLAYDPDPVLDPDRSIDKTKRSKPTATSDTPQQQAVSQYRPEQATVILSISTNRCGQQCYHLDKPQEVWRKHPPKDGKTTNVTQEPITRFPEEELANLPLSADGFRYLKNSQGSFRFKGDEVQREVVVGERNYQEQVAIRRSGCFGRVHTCYCWRQKSAVQLGWEKDNEAVIEKKKVLDPALDSLETPDQAKTLGRSPSDRLYDDSFNLPYDEFPNEQSPSPSDKVLPFLPPYDSASQDVDKQTGSSNTNLPDRPDNQPTDSLPMDSTILPPWKPLRSTKPDLLELPTKEAKLPPLERAQIEANKPATHGFFADLPEKRLVRAPYQDQALLDSVYILHTIGATLKDLNQLQSSVEPYSANAKHSLSQLADASNNQNSYEHQRDAVGFIANRYRRNSEAAPEIAEQFSGLFESTLNTHVALAEIAHAGDISQARQSVAQDYASAKAIFEDLLGKWEASGLQLSTLRQTYRSDHYYSACLDLLEQTLIDGPLE